MSDETAIAQAQQGTAAPAEGTSPAPEQVISEAAPQAAVASPDSEAQRLKRAQETRERIEELNAGKKAAIEVAEYWRKKFEEGQQQPAPAVAAAPETVDPEPNPDDFDDSKAYTKAWATWYDKRSEKRIQGIAAEAQKQAESAAERKLAKAAEEKRLHELNDGFALRQFNFEQQTPDYADVIRNPALTFFNGDFLEAIKGSEIGPQLAYQIGKDPKLIASFAGKSIPQRLAALGRLEADLSRPAPPPKITAAPAPPTPIGGGAGGDVDPSKMSINDWMNWRTKQIRERAKSR